MQPIVLEDLQASSPWQLSLYTKHHMAFSEGEGTNLSRKVNLCLWWCLSLLSDVEHGEVETWSAVSWAWLLLATPPARVQVTSQMVFSLLFMVEFAVKNKPCLCRDPLFGLGVLQTDGATSLMFAPTPRNT